MTEADLVITAEQIVRPDRIGPCAIAIKGGRILAVTEGPYPGLAHEVLDAGPCVVLPGLIDPHVHMRDPGLTEAEDWTTGTRAAVAGGVMTVLDHPNTVPSVGTLDGFIYKKEVAAGNAIVDFGLHAGAGEGNLDQMEALADAA